MEAGASERARGAPASDESLYNDFDVPGMLDLMHPDVEFRNLAGGQVTAEAHGRAELRALAEHAVTLFRSRRQTVRAHGAELVDES